MRWRRGRVRVGFAGPPGGYGVYGGIAVAGGYAGGFAGPVLVNGAFTVANGPKNAAVPHPDGSHRLLYCQESPEPWFGTAVVRAWWMAGLR